MGLEKISEYKKALGLTNEELAKLSGVPKGTLDKILSGITKDPKLGTLKSIAKVLNCTLDDFDDENTILKYNNLSQNESSLLENYNKLNDNGKEKLLDYSDDLTTNTKYIDNDEFTDIRAKKNKEQYYKDNSHLIPKASHDKEGNFTEEDYKHDDDIMKNDDLWK